ncbi:hypothetical protein COT48_04655 [Candidatus Woesearchaeota archaeon CG08_land_8_20_14_0_20_47_9]|nr:MAG: hypothetical protein COV22_04115 [Candidatus Woesearchaeota archaeon CG10_big_fil_rev_8_21_14_0_10_47_5]PIO03478.1 MAG: hypothetical protein COT48_04655 [Candidatus Woesearchaeota archaeon CG08_land_8_20_14_0_20_47_9]
MDSFVLVCGLSFIDGRGWTGREPAAEIRWGLKILQQCLFASFRKSRSKKRAKRQFEEWLD